MFDREGRKVRIRNRIETDGLGRETSSLVVGVEDEIDVETDHPDPP